MLIDTAKSFVYTEGGLKGVLMASRLSGLSPNLTSRFTPGTLISSYEVYEALRRGVAVPFRKRDAESIRNISELRASDKGGMIFQPEPGVYEKVHQIDFTSLYPSIIVKYNLSPETIEHPERTGFTLDLITFLQDLAPGKCLTAFRRSGRLAKRRTIEICVRSCCPSMHQLTHTLSLDWMSLE